MLTGALKRTLFRNGLVGGSLRMLGNSETTP
jgi:hypothetical protein